MTDPISGIFVALDDEIKTIYPKIVVDEKIYIKPAVITRGQFNEKPCLVVKTGIGKKAMYKAVTYCLENFNLTSCINIGYSGGTTPDLNIGDLVIANKILDADDNSIFSSNEALMNLAEKICKEQDLKTIQSGIVTVSEVIKTPHEKAYIGTEHEACALDMESSSFALACNNKNIPFLVIRSILDSLDVAIPDMENIIDEDGTLSYTGLAQNIVSKPKNILSFPKMEYCARKARISITSFLEKWIEGL